MRKNAFVKTSFCIFSTAQKIIANVMIIAIMACVYSQIKFTRLCPAVVISCWIVVVGGNGCSDSILKAKLQLYYPKTRPEFFPLPQR